MNIELDDRFWITAIGRSDGWHYQVEDEQTGLSYHSSEPESSQVLVMMNAMAWIWIQLEEHPTSR